MAVDNSIHISAASMRIYLTLLSICTLVGATCLMLSVGTCETPSIDILILSGTLAAISTLSASLSCQLATPLLYRIALLGFPAIILPAIILRTTGKISYNGLTFQTKLMAGIVLILGLISIASSLLGWKLGKHLTYRFPLFSVEPSKNLLFSDFNFRLLVRTPIILFTGYLTSIALGPPVWEAAYASQSSPIFLNLGALPSISGLLISVSAGEYLYIYRRSSTTTLVFSALSVFALVYFMLIRGMRLEPTAVLIAVFALWNESRNKRLPLTILVLSSVVLFLSIQLTGVLRANGSIADYLDWLGSLFHSQIADGGPPASRMIHLGTASDISATMFMTVGLVVGCMTPHLYGQSYFDYFARTLPQFIFPLRPEDMSSIFRDFGLSSGGGFFELAEAYLNFGVIGCIVTPMLISALLAISCSGAARRNRVAVWFLAAILFSILRGTWYQNFAIYKTLVAGILVDLIGVTLIVKMLKNILRGNNI